MPDPYALKGTHWVNAHRVRNGSGTKGTIYVDCEITVYDPALHGVLEALFAEEDVPLRPTHAELWNQVKVTEVTANGLTWSLTAYQEFSDVRHRYWYRSWTEKELREAPELVMQRLRANITQACSAIGAGLAVAAIPYELTICT